MKPGPKPKPRQPLTPEEVAAKKAAKAAYDREYRAKNADKIKAAKRAWGKTDVKKAYDAEYARKHAARVNAAKARYRGKAEAQEKYREWRRRDMASNRKSIGYEVWYEIAGCVVRCRNGQTQYVFKDSTRWRASSVLKSITSFL